MGKKSFTNPTGHRGQLLVMLILCMNPWAFLRGQGGASVQATMADLRRPSGLAYDAAGNLLFAEAGSHVVRRIDGSGALTTIAGVGIQGYSGDGGPATAAQLDSPAALSVDATGAVFVADSHNHRIRRIDPITGLITTFAGTGTAGLGADGTIASKTAIDLPCALAFDVAGDLFFADARTHVVRRIDRSTQKVFTVAGNSRQGASGDGGIATAASIDSPRGLAFAPNGDLFFSDTHNATVRRVDHVTSIINTVAGTGRSGFGGDFASAASASLSLPLGLAADASGDLYIVDSSNQRIRRIDALTGEIRSLAGNGMQGLSGDANAASTASINNPRDIVVSRSGVVTLSDTGNDRLRQVDVNGIFHTVAGLGSDGSSSLNLTAATKLQYGSGYVTATLSGTPATGSVTFSEQVGGTSQKLGSIALAGNSASFSMSALPIGLHQITALYNGDLNHQPSQSSLLSVTMVQRPLFIAANSVSILYGQPIPPLTGTTGGLLSRDQGLISLLFYSSALPLSPPGTYDISASITGAAAGNYALVLSPASLKILPAPSVISLSTSLVAHVGSTTSGIPSGSLRLLDGGVFFASKALSSSGDAAFDGSNLSSGAHTLSAQYAGDHNFAGSVSSPLIYTIGSSGVGDFSLSSVGAANISVLAGSPASFSFAVTPMNGGVSSAVNLSVSGLPPGATATFSPAYLPALSATSALQLTVQTPSTAGILNPSSWSTWALTGLPLILFARRRKRYAPVVLSLLLITGCGNRVNGSAATSSAARTYNMTVTATGTSATGVPTVHSVSVTLSVL